MDVTVTVNLFYSFMLWAVVISPSSHTAQSRRQSKESEEFVALTGCDCDVTGKSKSDRSGLAPGSASGFERWNG